MKKMSKSFASDPDLVIIGLFNMLYEKILSVAKTSENEYDIDYVLIDNIRHSFKLKLCDVCNNKVPNTLLWAIRDLILSEISSLIWEQIYCDETIHVISDKIRSKLNRLANYLILNEKKDKTEDILVFKSSNYELYSAWFDDEIITKDNIWDLVYAKTPSFGFDESMVKYPNIVMVETEEIRRNNVKH